MSTYAPLAATLQGINAYVRYICSVFSVATCVLRASLWLCCAYVTGGLTADQEGEGGQDKSDHDEKGDDDDNKGHGDNNGDEDDVEPIQMDPALRTAAAAAKEQATPTRATSPAACEGAGIPDTDSARPGPTLEWSTRIAD